MGRFVDLSGRRFGRLMVIGRGPDQIPACGKPAVMWRCKCDCGNESLVRSYALTSGHTKSCGCGVIKHGFSHKERLYETWKNMRRRCNDPTNKRYANYGGRGIQVCPEWKADYLSFRGWALSNGYGDNLTIDRINNDKGYSPDNCRWVSHKIQANNVSRNRIIHHFGISLTLSEWADLIGISYSAINHRIQRAWPMERIVKTPERGKENVFKGLPKRMP